MDKVYILMVEGKPSRAYASLDRANEDLRLAGKIGAVELGAEVVTVDFVGGRQRKTKAASSK